MSAAEEVRAAFDRYERALVAHDTVALHGFFLHRDDTVRFGVAEESYGAAAIDAWRRAAPPVARGRLLTRVVVQILTPDVACVSAEFSDPSVASGGRQSQTWLRTADGWKIAAAHVSHRRV